MSQHRHVHPAAAGTRPVVIAGAAAALAAAAVFLVASPAAAHVHVDGDAVPGERATIAFSVPNESDTASTVGLSVTIPTDAALTSVRARSKPGWEVEVGHVELDPPVVHGDVTITSAVASVTWTATGGGVAPGEYDEFVLQLGPIPDVAELVLPVEQRYDDGTVAPWEGEEAPVLAIGAAAEPASADPLALAALVVGAVALAAALLALLRPRRRQP